MTGPINAVAAPQVAKRLARTATLQKSVIDRRVWAAREDLRSANVTGIARTYHRRLCQDRLGRLTPVESDNCDRATRSGGAATHCDLTVQQSRFIVRTYSECKRH